MIRIYPSFDSMMHSDQFALRELFPESVDDFENIRWILTGFGDNELEVISELMFDLGGDDSNIVATIDETSENREATWVYGIVFDDSVYKAED